DLGPDPEAIRFDSNAELRRSAKLFRFLQGRLPNDRFAQILDFGGGDGRLMREFFKRGHDCYLVDYREDTLPGVRRIGSTEADIPLNAKFDLIVCSQVVEHLANPKRVLSCLAEHLDTRGHLYIEVPLEVWRHAPLHEEPVTHVNFFTASSLQR